MKNIGIFAHVDAGKTTTSEMILYHKGIIPHVGSVNRGTTLTDSLAIEKRRGISVKAAFVSMEHNGEKINLIDTPGHVQFFSEVINSLTVIDGAILIISAIEGIQSQTLMIYEYLTKNKIPIYFYINIIDRDGANILQLQKDIEARFQTTVFMFHGNIEKNVHELVNFLSEKSASFFDDYCAGKIDTRNILSYVKPFVENRSILFGSIGSSKCNLGIEDLIHYAFYLLPSVIRKEGELSAYVFNHGFIHEEKVLFLKIMQGKMELKQVYLVDEMKLKINQLMVGTNGKYVEAQEVESGDIAMIPFLNKLPLGSFLGEKGKVDTIRLPIPMFRAEISFEALNQPYLSDILTKLKEDYQELNVKNINGKIYMDFYDEFHKTIIKEMFTENYSLKIRVDDIYPIKKTKFLNISELIITSKNSPEYSGLGLRVTPQDTQHVSFHSSIMKGSLKEGYIQAVNDSIKDYCENGIDGKEIIGCDIELFYFEYDSVFSSPSEYYRLTQYVMDGICFEASFEILEPFIHLELLCPEDCFTNVLNEVYGYHVQVEIVDMSNIHVVLPLIQVEKLEKSLFKISEGHIKIIHHESIYKKN